MNPITVAIRGKGLRKAVARGIMLFQRYGLTNRKMDAALQLFAKIMQPFGGAATFPIVSKALQRNPAVIQKYQAQGIEFAMHGLHHFDHALLSYEEQQPQLTAGQQIFQQCNITLNGFRGPYLHYNEATLRVLNEIGLHYDSSPSLFWDVVPTDTADYQHVRQFYGARSASVYPSLPYIEGNLVRLPYSLPDDEALIERLTLSPAQMNGMWVNILLKSYQLGELFVIGLHPERIALCQAPLEAALNEARQLDPPVWVARLHEIAAWWQARHKTAVQITPLSNESWQISLNGPEGLTVLGRGVTVDVPSRSWFGQYQEIQATQFSVTSPTRPFIGVAPTTAPALVDFLRQQGYLIETSSQANDYPYYFNQTTFTAEQQRPLLALLEEASNAPLIRLSRWPNRVRSAVSVTGDIDALTVWDYIIRAIS